MGIEIERKFLVVNDTWRAGASGQHYRQGYLCSDPDRVVRVRLTPAGGYLTLKGRACGATRAEFEYAIPAADAAALLAMCTGALIEKERYRVPHAGRTWEVDVFAGDNQGLIVAEIELEAEDAVIELPPWAGAEVTHDRRYHNSSLAHAPYALWRTPQEN